MTDAAPEAWLQWPGATLPEVVLAGKDSSLHAVAPTMCVCRNHGYAGLCLVCLHGHAMIGAAEGRHRRRMTLALPVI